MSVAPRTPALTTLGGRSVLFAMAADAEYGPHLKQRFTPLITGVGPVEAAVELTAALAALAQQGRLPDLVVSLIMLRGISDGKAELHHVDDWTEYLHVIDEKLATAVNRLGEAIAGGLLKH